MRIFQGLEVQALVWDLGLRVWGVEGLDWFA